MSVASFSALNCRQLPPANCRKPGEICIHRDILITLQRFHDFCDMIDPDLFPLFANSSQPLSSQLSADEFNELEEEFNDYAVNPQVKVADHVIPKESLLISKMVNLYAQRLIHEQKDLPDWIQKLLDRMSNPLYFNTSLQEILDEQKICYEKAYLCRVFKKYVGCSMIAYITNSKLNHAVSLLRFTSMPIANIASQSGFANVTYFNKLFKRSFGIPPAKYRILSTENSDIR